MNRNNWIIILSVILLATAAIVVMLVLAYRSDPLIPVSAIKHDNPPPIVAADDMVLRFEVQLKDDDPQKRLDAILMLSALAEKQEDRIGPVMVKALDNDDSAVRSAAALGLASMKYAPAATRLTALLDDHNEQVRLQSAQALVSLGDPGLQAVMQGLSENSLKNTDHALVVVSRIAGRNFGLGKKGREAAFRFWAQQNTQSP